MAYLSDYRRTLAYALDDLQVEGATSGTTTTVTIGNLVNTATGVTSALYEGTWLFHESGANAPQQLKVISYVPSTGVLTFTPAGAAIGSTEVVELTHLFPAQRAVGAETDYRTLVNRALSKMMAEVDVDVAIVRGARTVALTNQPWLNRPERLLGVREPAPFDSDETVDAAWRQWELVPGDPVSSLRCRTPFLADTAVTLRAIRPASTWIATAGVWAEKIDNIGLANETDQALPATAEFLPFGLVEALTVLLARSPGRPNAEWQRLLKDAQDAVAMSRYRDRTQRVEQAPAVPAQGAA